MGLLVLGEPYTWPDIKRCRTYIKRHGIKQFLNILQKFCDRVSDKFLWGDEIEGIVLHFDHENKKARISLRAHAILDQLQKAQEEAERSEPGSAWNVTFQPEHGNFMIEVTPGTPYGNFTSDLRMVEPNMRLRRCLILAHLAPHETYVTMTNYPLLGAGDFSVPKYPTNGPVLKSNYLPDQVLSPHPRFASLAGNIRRRRGKRPNIKIPIYQDLHTTASSAGNVTALDERPELRAKEKEIYMDAMTFGMGCCCLQVTFQTRSVDEARQLYDQLAILSPILLALTANTPVHRGRLADTDVRWDVISQSVDDRTDEEMGFPIRKNENPDIMPSPLEALPNQPHPLVFSPVVSPESPVEPSQRVAS